MGFCTFGTVVIFFYLQEKIFIEKDELLNLDLLWKNKPYAKIRESLASWDQELTFFGPPVTYGLLIKQCIKTWPQHQSGGYVIQSFRNLCNKRNCLHLSWYWDLPSSISIEPVPRWPIAPSHPGKVVVPHYWIVHLVCLIAPKWIEPITWDWSHFEDILKENMMYFQNEGWRAPRGFQGGPKGPQMTKNG